MIALSLFRVMVVLALPFSMAAQPGILFSRTSGGLELRWQVSSNFSSQLESAGNLLNWQPLGMPLAAPAANGWVTNVVGASGPQKFYRVRFSPLATSAVPTAPGDYPNLTFVSGGITRSYRLFIPTNYAPSSPPAPLAFILHGAGQTANSFAALHPDLPVRATQAGMILVYPQSIEDERGTRWSTTDPVPGEPYVDDAVFLLQLLDHLAGSLNIDRQRVYAGGFSNGGVMTHYLGARTTNTFAALAAVGAAITSSEGGTNLIYVPAPAQTMPVLIVNATNDCARPYWGGLADSGGLQPSVQEAVDHWVTNANQCFAAPVVTTNTNVLPWFDRPNYTSDCPDVNPTNGFITNLVIRSTWIGCSNWVEVAQVTLTDGGHLWPDADDKVGFDANEEVIAFFLRHCRCEAGTNNLVIPTTPGQSELSFCDQGYWRKFRLMIPAGYTGAAARPLFFTFHGGGQTIAEFSALHPDLFAKCNTEGAFLVLPEATRHPRSLDTLWGNKPFEIVVDDRGFVTNLLEQLDGGLNLNRKRVYGTGFSNGGRFCNWFAATWTNVFAGLAPVCSQVGWNDPVTGVLVTPPAPLEPLPVFMIRGSLDPRQPFFGGTNDTGQLTFSAAQDLGFWVSGSSCTPPPLTNTVGIVSEWRYTNCLNSAVVKLEGVSGLGHEWPEAPAYNASLRVVDFLLLFSRP